MYKATQYYLGQNYINSSFPKSWKLHPSRQFKGSLKKNLIFFVFFEEIFIYIFDNEILFPGTSYFCTRLWGPSYVTHKGFPDRPGQLSKEVHGHLQPGEELWGKGVDCDVFHVKTVSMQEVLNQICSTLFDYPMIRNCSELVKYINNCVNTAWGLSTMVKLLTLYYMQQVQHR